MESPKESFEKKNIFAEKYDEIRRLDGIFFRLGEITSVSGSSGAQAAP